MVGLIHVVNVHGLDFVYGNHYGVERFFRDYQVHLIKDVTDAIQGKDLETLPGRIKDIFDTHGNYANKYWPETPVVTCKQPVLVVPTGIVLNVPVETNEMRVLYRNLRARFAEIFEKNESKFYRDDRFQEFANYIKQGVGNGFMRLSFERGVSVDVQLIEVVRNLTQKEVRERTRTWSKRKWDAYERWQLSDSAFISDIIGHEIAADWFREE
jgi:hypothetical protein